jgi:hypothetical protein
VNDLVLWLSIAALFLGALALSLGVRGRRIDREPRCPARRCKYALGGVISAKRAQSEDPYPLTCPECGRTIAHERSLRIGTRRTIKPVVALGIALLLVCTAIVGIEGHALWKNSQAVNTMPLWLLLHQAKSDTAANGHIHQTEIVRRANARLLNEAQSQRVIGRVLRWQLDPRINIEVIADALTPLHEQGQLSQEQIERYWEQIHLFELRVRGPAVPGEILPLEVRTHFRGARMTNAPLARDVNGNWAHRSFVSSFTEVWIDALRIGRATVALPDEWRTMYGQMDPAPDMLTRDLAWRPHMSEAWDHLRVPRDSTGSIDVRLKLRWSSAHPLGREVEPGVTRTLTELLEDAGVPSSGVVELSQRVPVAKDRPPQVMVDDALARAWFDDQLRRALLNLDPQRISADQFTMVRFPRAGWNTQIPTSDTHVIGDLWFRCQGREFGPLYIETHPRVHHRAATALPASVTEQMLDLALSNPDDWEIVFVPRPERAATRVDDIQVLGGDPIVVPLRITTTGNREAIQLLQDERDAAHPLPR